ncbi:cellulose synthase/poly-beta-1,6-N-acetylglucosamine synthase-like glycosyltransferase [Okibacterium sp. HSC-33S16]|uniref:glycosyltransferase family 2 protein n=1 Tax=Okibacterium sp. HSC-33S16 TaxID=2910965 RepID=UPI00209F790E|nr:glycosyltransferase [Okibacterium sp. HSC-33S16]MCP2030513.1 cellulose synthase/poly-beta-1,6-N-acetylglucosamine synthase-like glycosyltransferase [Okibacterium sp. HSC-33S16]
MTGIDIGAITAGTLTVVFLVFVFTGAIPVISAAYSFLAIPLHAFRNHYAKAKPYTPRVAIVIPAWNEGAVIGASIDRLMALDYPLESLRLYVVDDASTDDTPDVIQAKEQQYPGNVFHLRREQGGQGKAHTLNHGIRLILEDDWMEALLVMDADVIYTPNSLRRMTRHLADPDVGAVSAYIREGSKDKNYLTRFIALEYVLSQPAARRAQNVLGAQACLAGGAQLHSRENLIAIGGQIDTSSLAEDTITTFETQLRGRKVVFEPLAVVLAEEPGSIDALWKQRLRWARGNVTVTSRYRRIWFRPSRVHKLGTISFGLVWFSLWLLPIAMVLSSIGLVGLLLLESDLASTVFRALWISAACTFAFTLALGVQLDSELTRITWREVLTFPGIISMLVMLTAFFPGVLLDWVPSLFHLRFTSDGLFWVTLSIYIWISVSMFGAWIARKIENTAIGRVLTPVLIYLVGYGSLLCAITFDSYIKELRHAEAKWDKTEKTGRVTA